MQNESLNHTISHNKYSNLVLPTGQFSGTIEHLLGKEFTSTHPPHSNN